MFCYIPRKVGLRRTETLDRSKPLVSPLLKLQVSILAFSRNVRMKLIIISCFPWSVCKTTLEQSLSTYFLQFSIEHFDPSRLRKVLDRTANDGHDEDRNIVGTVGINGKGGNDVQGGVG